MIERMKRADEMRELFARWKDSRQSLMAFGKAEGVSYQTLLYWRRKLGDYATRRAPRKKPTPVSFAPLTIVPDEATPDPEMNGGKYELWFANGVTLDVAPGFDESELRRLVAVLLSC